MTSQKAPASSVGQDRRTTATDKHPAILFAPHWTFSHLCEVPSKDGMPVPFVQHEGEVFERVPTADQHDKHGRVAAYRFIDAPTV